VLQSVAVGPYDLVVLIGGKPVGGHFEARPTSNRARATLPVKVSASVPISL